MARTAFVFYDPVTTDSYSLPINPNAGGSPSRSKNLSFESTSAPGGRALIFEGQDSIPQMNYSGVILSEELYNKLFEWYEKRNIIQVTDDLGRTFDVYIKSFSPDRVRSVSHEWRHTYSMELVVLEGY